MYLLSCRDCSAEYLFKRKKILRLFGTECPRCGEKMSRVPVPGFIITPPPDMRVVKRDVKRVGIRKM